MNDLQKPLVSVISLTYKNFESLRITMESVINQDYPNIEYIISDDGSENFPEDEVDSFLQNHPESTIRVFRNNVNVGTVKNINSAYRQSNGKYLINLSCGDVFYSSHVISDIVNRFIQTRSDVIVTSRVAYKGSLIPEFFLPHYFDRKIIESWKSSERQYAAFVTSSFLNMASGSAMHFSREVIENQGYFDERYKLWEDGPFIEKFLRNNRITTAYDIVSIWYELGGVSTSGVNPVLNNDTILFNLTDRLNRYNDLSWWNKAKITYRNKSLTCGNKTERIELKIKMFPVFIFFLASYLKSRLNCFIDKLILKRMKAYEVTR